MKKSPALLETLSEPLTRRELAILAHLAAGQSNQQIASSESLALSSTKWYVHQICAKLGVNKRWQAVERARALGLLPPASMVIPSSAPAPARNNLPVQITSFIGRQKEILELGLLLRQQKARLVTLTGSGGTGKTRLALQAAAGLLDAFPDGICLVELAALSDPALIPQTVIAALGQVEQPDRPPMVQLADYLGSKQLLLILDNCEHLIEACASLAASLLQVAPCLTLLATSREILGVPGERPYRVPPLETPDPRKLPPLAELAGFDAVRLFVERAQVVAPGFALREDNAAEVAHIAQRLDGIPLALELAAARLRHLSVAQIAQRLNDAFRLLTGGSRTILPRHQTLTALIDWSYNLLSETERRLLHRLSVFAGSWRLEAAEVICADEQMPASEILDTLSQLLDKSLIQVAQTRQGEMRYRMLETVRQYAHAHLVAAGEVAAVRQRHLDYYLDLAERLEPRLRSREQIQTLNDWESELDNLRLAVEWALQEDIEAGLRLAAALMWFWHIRYHWSEGVAWLERGLEAELATRGDRVLTGARALVRAKALAVLGNHLMIRDLPLSLKDKAVLDEALLLNPENRPECRLGRAWALAGLSEYAWRGEFDPRQAEALARQALSLFRACGDAHGMAECLMRLGACEIDPARRKKIHLEQLALEEANGDPDGIATALFFLGVTELIDGAYQSAGATFEKSREYHRLVGNPDTLAVSECFIGIAALFNGELERAALYLEKALAENREMVYDSHTEYCLFWKIQLVIACGEYQRAAADAGEVWDIAQKTGDRGMLTDACYHRARLARLNGQFAAARQYAEQGLKTGVDLASPSMYILVELGHLALREGDLAQAGRCWREGLALLLRQLDFALTRASLPLDCLAVLAVRAGKYEQAARLFGTRLLRGAANILSPLERAERAVEIAKLTAALGEERFARLQAEGAALTFTKILALAQAED